MEEDVSWCALHGVRAFNASHNLIFHGWRPPDKSRASFFFFFPPLMYTIVEFRRVIWICPYTFRPMMLALFVVIVVPVSFCIVRLPVATEITGKAETAHSQVHQSRKGVTTSFTPAAKGIKFRFSLAHLPPNTWVIQTENIRLSFWSSWRYRFSLCDTPLWQSELFAQGFKHQTSLGRSENIVQDTLDDCCLTIAFCSFEKTGILN